MVEASGRDRELDPEGRGRERLGIEAGEIDPTFVITHRATLEDGPDLYKRFRDKEDGCIKVVMQP